jgi:hypothetical protein
MANDSVLGVWYERSLLSKSLDQCPCIRELDIMERSPIDRLRQQYN